MKTLEVRQMLSLLGCATLPLRGASPYIEGLSPAIWRSHCAVASRIKSARSVSLFSQQSAPLLPEDGGSAAPTNPT